MPDTREEILARLVEVVTSVPGAVQVLRNQLGLSETARPAIIILDADEAAEEEDLPGSRSADAPQRIAMTPELFVLVSHRAAGLGAELNTLRRRILRRVLTDGPLAALVGPNGSIRYAGCGTALALGRSMEGEMSLSFTFRYVLKPSKLED